MIDNTYYNEDNLDFLSFTYNKNSKLYCNIEIRYGNLPMVYIYLGSISTLSDYRGNIKNILEKDYTFVFTHSFILKKWYTSFLNAQKYNTHIRINVKYLYRILDSNIEKNICIE